MHSAGTTVGASHSLLLPFTSSKHLLPRTFSHASPRPFAAATSLSSHFVLLALFSPPLFYTRVQMSPSLDLYPPPASLHSHSLAYRRTLGHRHEPDWASPHSSPQGRRGADSDGYQSRHTVLTKNIFFLFSLSTVRKGSRGRGFSFFLYSRSLLAHVTPRTRKGGVTDILRANAMDKSIDKEQSFNDKVASVQKILAKKEEVGKEGEE